MSRILRYPIIALLMLATIESSSSAEDDTVEKSDKWVPSREKHTSKKPEDVFQKPVIDAVQIDIDSNKPLHELIEPAKILEPSETNSLPDVVEETAGRLSKIPGRPYNASGWYSAPDWGSTTWRPGRGNRFGDFSLEGVSADPIKFLDGLSLTHGTGIHFLTGPTKADMPPRVFDLKMGLHWFGEISNYMWVDLSFTAGLFSDFEDSVREGWRFPSHAVFSWEFSPQVQPVAGVRYYDRNNLGLLPVAGLILRPDDDVRIELVYPEPRVAWLVATDAEKEYWLSVSGRIGGGEWTIERNGSGLADVATYNDYQIVLALDRVHANQSRSSYEIGYVFQRDLEYRSGLGNFNPSETFFIRSVTRK